MAKNELKICGEITWVDVMDPSEAEMEELSRQYALHKNTVRDCMQPEHLPKYEFVDDVHFLILRFYCPVSETVATIQELTNKIAIFYTDHFIITIHKSGTPFLDVIQKKVVEVKKCSTTDVLAKIIWNALESFDDPANNLSGQVDKYESEIMLRKLEKDQMPALYIIKRQASISHKVLTLMLEPINHQHANQGEDSALQDMRDQHLKMLTLYSQLLEDVHNLMELAMSFSAQRTNEVVRILTLFSVFFMPLTFIVGVYGMNFKFMPELSLRWGYPAVWVSMGIVTLIIYIWFKRKRWL